MASAADAARLRRIEDRVRSAGVQVREIEGRLSRGSTWTRTPVGLIDHHDASTAKSGEWGALGVVTYGRTGIPGPLGNFQVARCLDGVPRIASVAAGRANHAGLGGPYGPVPKDSGNSWLYGIEKAHDGGSEPITKAAHYATDVLFWAILQETQDPDLLIGHKEWTPRKIDPVYSMRWRRDRVANLSITAPQEDDVMDAAQQQHVYAQLAEIRRLAGGLVQPSLLGGTERNFAAESLGRVDALTVEFYGLSAAVQALSQALSASQNVDGTVDAAEILATVKAATDAGVKQALTNLEVTLAVPAEAGA